MDKKKVKNLENKKISTSKMSILTGGKWIQTSSSTRNIQSPDGGTCVQTTIDGYNDTNGNGKMDKGEVKTTCSEINCN